MGSQESWDFGKDMDFVTAWKKEKARRAYYGKDNGNTMSDRGALCH